MLRSSVLNENCDCVAFKQAHVSRVYSHGECKCAWFKQLVKAPSNIMTGCACKQISFQSCAYSDMESEGQLDESAEACPQSSYGSDAIRLCNAFVS